MQDPTDKEVTIETDEKKRVDASLNTQQPPSYVLVVDDEPAVRGFLAHCLEEWGYTVRQAGSADEALDLMVANPASVVLVDVKMPGHDGLWLAERVRATWPGTPVVIGSGPVALQTNRQGREHCAVG